MMKENAQTLYRVYTFPLGPKCTPILFKQMTGKDKKQRFEAPALKWGGGGD